MGNFVQNMQHVLLMHTFIWAVYRQVTAPSKKKQNNPGYVHEAKTSRLLIIQNTSLYWKTWGQEYCTVL